MKVKSYKAISAATVFGNPIHMLAFGFGSGLAKKAPGTFGTLAAIPIYFLLSTLPTWPYVGVVIAAALFGIWLCELSSTALGVDDHPGIVWDEITGFLITMIAVPFSWLNILLGFALFRLFDIWKPWPISLIDRKVHGGLGIMLDDLLAGVFAALTLQAILMLL